MNLIDVLVQDRYGKHGYVTKYYDDFSAVASSCMTMTGDEWLQEQMIPFTQEHLEEMWCDVQLVNGGCIWSPVSLLMIVE